MGVSAHVDDSLNPCKPLAWEDLTSKKEPKQDPFKKKKKCKKKAGKAKIADTREKDLTLDRLDTSGV